jgi:predicted transcriptional regulator
LVVKQGVSVFDVTKYVTRLKYFMDRDLLAISEMPKMTKISMAVIHKMLAGETRFRVDVLRRLRDFVDNYEGKK